MQDQYSFEFAPCPTSKKQAPNEQDWLLNQAFSEFFQQADISRLHGGRHA
jgi:hypothetical protein